MTTETDIELPQLQLGGRVHRAHLDIDVFEAARRRVEYLYANYDHIVISWSGGKDSSCVLELARETARKMGKLPVKVLFVDEEVLYPETIDLALKHHADPDFDFKWVCASVQYRNACSEKEPEFITWDRDKKDLWVRQPPDFAIWPWGIDNDPLKTPPHPADSAMRMVWPKEQYPLLCDVTGLRTRESFSRYSGMLSSKSYISGTDNRGCIRVRPIYDWHERDVWLAIQRFGWDYNKAYDKLWRLGCNAQNARVAPIFGAESSQVLRKVMLGWPKWWPLVRRRVRGAHAMAIYDGALHEARLLEGETWRDAAYRYLASHAPHIRDEQTGFLNLAINRHAGHSPFDFHETKQCSECGLSWKYITRAVIQANQYGRMFRKAPGIASRPKPNQRKKENA